MENNQTRKKVRERLLALQGSLTNQQFADKLGLSRQTLGFWQREERTPSAENIVDIADRCGVSTDYLLGKSEARTNKPEVATMKEYTGLSEVSIEALHYMKDAPLDSPARSITAAAMSFINRALEYYSWLVNDLTADSLREEYCHYVPSIFAFLEQWITGSGDPSIRTIGGYVVREDELFREVMMTNIKKSLESMAEEDNTFSETVQKSKEIWKEQYERLENEDPDQEEK